MRNLLLSLVLANLFLLAWQFWVDPSPASPDAEPGMDGGELALFADGAPRASPRGAGRTTTGDAAPPIVDGGEEAASCLRVGPFPDSIAAQQTRRQLATRGIPAALMARDTQRWLGHWVNIIGFGSAAEAEVARQRLVAGGIVDAYLMQDGAQPLVSLGVFRDRDGATTVAGAARRLGFDVNISDRYRPAVEQWLLIRPAPGQRLVLAETGLKDDLIRRAESAPCGQGAETGLASDSTESAVDLAPGASAPQ